MNPDAERFIELATRPLDDNAELQLAAVAELRKSIEEHGGKNLQAVAEMVDALEQTDERLRWWRWVLAVAMLLVSLPLLAHTVLQFKQFTQVRSLVSFGMPERPAVSGIPNLSAAQRLLLFGDIESVNEAGKWKALWDSEPGNPQYLAVYALAYFQDHKALTPEIIAAAERLDPDNAWFPALVAAGIAESSVRKERVPYMGVRVRNTKAAVWIIEDEKRLNDALAAIHQLAGSSRFTDYQTELLQQRIPLFPPRRDYVSQLPPLVYSLSLPSGSVAMRKLPDVLAAGAQQCATKGDVDGFRRITRDWKFLADVSVRDAGNMIDGLVARAIILSPLNNFRDAALALGLEEEAREFAALEERLYQEKESRMNKEDEIQMLLVRHGSTLASLSLPVLQRQVNSPPPLSAADLRPGRYAEHALFERMSTWAAWMLLGICAGAAMLSRFLRSPVAWRLSGSMQNLFRSSDWAWVVLGGIVLPVVWYFCITRLTPLAAREWNMRMNVFIQPGGQFGCMVLSMIILPVLIASRRLAMRGAAIGLVPRFAWFGDVAAGAALLGVPAFGGIMYPGEIGQAFQLVAYGLAGLATVWIFWGFVVSARSGEEQALRRATLARLLPPVWLMGMLFLAALVPVFYAEERHWIQQDKIYAMSAEFPGPTRYEHDVTQILRAELLEILEQAGSTR